ncbi:MAG: hypothetical protein K0S76_1461 [Herbinix sp.]|jgi:hypothetical protein|nr:hypothetical protein [Herbinix sp.]
MIYMEKILLFLLSICYNLIVNVGKAPIKKNCSSHLIEQILTRGRIPITKNIIVIDEQGNEYEATYPKRAKGLIKNGRARFVDDNKICLVCPPDKYLEDNEMENKETQNTIEVSKDDNKFSLKYVLEQIEYIARQNQYIIEIIEKLSKLENYGPGDLAGQAKAEALRDVVRCRETTNQKLLDMYQKMYEDLRPRQQRLSTDVEIINKMIEMISQLDPEDAKDVLSAQFKRMI